MFSVKIISIFSLLSVLCKFSLAHKLIEKKCSFKDNDCNVKLMESILRKISSGGIPEFGIPAIDPFVVKNISVPILDSVVIGMPDGLAKGIKKCKFNEISTDMVKKIFKLDFVCDIVIKGKYEVTADSPLLVSILGTNKLDARGFCKLALDKVHFMYQNDFFFRKGNDGEMYIDYKQEGIRYTYDVEKVQYYLDNLLINGQDFSSIIMSLMNDNWKFIMGSFGKPFMDKVMEIVYASTHKFYEAVPAKDLVIEDLSPYY